MVINDGPAPKITTQWHNAMWVKKAPKLPNKSSPDPDPRRRQSERTDPDAIAMGRKIPPQPEKDNSIHAIRFT